MDSFLSNYAAHDTVTSMIVLFLSANTELLSIYSFLVSNLDRDGK